LSHVRYLYPIEFAIEKIVVFELVYLLTVVETVEDLLVVSSRLEYGDRPDFIINVYSIPFAFFALFARNKK
jgi:hypothetical protein